MNFNRRYSVYKGFILTTDFLGFIAYNRNLKIATRSRSLEGLYYNINHNQSIFNY